MGILKAKDMQPKISSALFYPAHPVQPDQVIEDIEIIHKFALHPRPPPGHRL